MGHVDALELEGDEQWGVAGEIVQAGEINSLPGADARQAGQRVGGITDDVGELVTEAGAAVVGPSGEGQVEDRAAGGDLFLDLSLGWERAGWFPHEHGHYCAVGEPSMLEGVVVAGLGSPRSCETCVPLERRSRERRW